MLLIGTSCDSITPAAVHHQPVANAYLAEPVKLEQHVFATDHALSDHRVALARTVIRFLSTYLPGQQ